MDRVLSLTTFEQERQANAALAYWLSRSPEERLAEIDRLRGEYMAIFQGAKDEISEGLRRSLLLVDR
jgi:hypothetical protein